MIDRGYVQRVQIDHRQGDLFLPMLEVFRTATSSWHTAFVLARLARSPCHRRVAAVAVEPGEAVSSGRVAASWRGIVRVIRAI